LRNIPIGADCRQIELRIADLKFIHELEQASAADASRAMPMSLAPAASSSRSASRVRGGLLKGFERRLDDGQDRFRLRQVCLAGSCSRRPLKKMAPSRPSPAAKVLRASAGGARHAGVSVRAFRARRFGRGVSAPGLDGAASAASRRTRGEHLGRFGASSAPRLECRQAILPETEQVLLGTAADENRRARADNGRP